MCSTVRIKTREIRIEQCGVGLDHNNSLGWGCTPGALWSLIELLSICYVYGSAVPATVHSPLEGGILFAK